MNCVESIIGEILERGFTENNLRIVLNDYNISKKSTSLAIAEDTKQKAVKMFIVTKKVEGCSDKTIKYYLYVLKRFFEEVCCPFNSISADQIRYYLAMRAERDKLSKVTQDNELRVLKSFFSWCSAEDYLLKNPTLNIKAVKKEKRIKKPFTEVELEMLRKHAKNKRDLAIIETFYSTGCRVSELCGMSRNDLNGDEVLVFGKGGKERICYLNARAQLAVKEYLAERTDSEKALFVSLIKPFARVKQGNIQRVMRAIGKISGVEDCHPHRFRRTAATIALNRGMPIEQVQKMLGHSNIETTTIYAQSDVENVKASHKKYVV